MTQKTKCSNRVRGVSLLLVLAIRPQGIIPSGTKKEKA